MLLVFLMSIFDIRRYNAFIDESVEKSKSISSKHGDFKILPYIARKRLFEQIIRNYPF